MMGVQLSWVESAILLIELHHPLSPDTLNAIPSQITSLAQTAPLPLVAILLDTRQVAAPIDPALWSSIEALPQRLAALAPVISLQTDISLKRLWQMSPLRAEGLSLHFAADVSKALNMIRAWQQRQTGASSGFADPQTRSLFQHFIMQPAIALEWRQTVETIYDDDEIIFSTLELARAQGWLAEKGITVNWHQIIMALLNFTDDLQRRQSHPS
jgi:hypothetical protein